MAISELWLTASELLNLVFGSTAALTKYIGEVGVVLLTAALAGVLMTIFIIGLGEIGL